MPPRRWVLLAVALFFTILVGARMLDLSNADQTVDLSGEINGDTADLNDRLDHIDQTLEKILDEVSEDEILSN